MLSFYYIKYLNSGGRPMKYRRLLFWVKDPYSDSSDELFTKAVKENFSYCISHCDDYR